MFGTSIAACQARRASTERTERASMAMCERVYYSDSERMCCWDNGSGKVLANG